MFSAPHSVGYKMINDFFHIGSCTIIADIFQLVSQRTFCSCAYICYTYIHTYRMWTQAINIGFANNSIKRKFWILVSGDWAIEIVTTTKTTTTATLMKQERKKHGWKKVSQAKAFNFCFITYRHFCMSVCGGVYCYQALSIRACFIECYVFCFFFSFGLFLFWFL